jgi:UDPglucose 6-dehydrogenase
MSNIKTGIIGLGFVGQSILQSFHTKDIDVIGYDKYKNGGIGDFNAIVNCDIIFLCLPTLFSEETQTYDKISIYEVCDELEKSKYKGIVVLKSTVEPETTNKLSEKYRNLKIIHNPEFLTARTAFEDFHNQTHIVIGYGPNCVDDGQLVQFYSKYYPKAEITVCFAIESESMKIFCNSFYASKIMLFNEYYLLCKKNGSDFNKIKNIMLKNKWINPMHTDIPGSGGLLGYGGACFPKDTKALLSYMKEQNTPCKVLENVVNECSIIRKD